MSPLVRLRKRCMYYYATIPQSGRQVIYITITFCIGYIADHGRITFGKKITLKLSRIELMGALMVIYDPDCVSKTLVLIVFVGVLVVDIRQ